MIFRELLLLKYKMLIAKGKTFAFKGKSTKLALERGSYQRLVFPFLRDRGP